MNRLRSSLLTIALASALGGCIDIGGSNSGGGDNFAPLEPGVDADRLAGLCTPIAGGNSQLVVDDQRCPSCEITRPNEAFDGRVETFSEVRFFPLGELTLTGRSQAGTVTPAGRAGGLVLRATTGNTSVLRVQVTTLLDGVETATCISRLRAVATDANGVGVNCTQQTAVGQPGFFGVGSPSPFNEIEVVIDLNEAPLGSPVEIYELCVR